MLIDTSGWLCLYHKDEPQHVEAVVVFEKATSYLTTSYILAEFVPLAQVRGLPRAKSLEFTQKILADPTVEIVWVGEEMHTKGVDFLLSRQDKTYSLCDAISFLLMRQYGLTKALTTDRHFEQEGFVRLLK